MSEPRQPPAADSKHPPPKGRGAPPAYDLARIVRDHQTTVWRYLRYLGAAPHEADDLTQETFLALARSKFVEQSPQQTSAYLRTTARRQLLMCRRREQRQITTVEVEAADAVWAEAFGDRLDAWDEHSDTLRGCVEKLDGRPRQAIGLCYHEGLSREAIANRLEMTPDGVKTLLRRTRAKLRECIEKTLSVFDE